uniref:Cytochrome P450 3A18 n=1 Tax=Anthurium amnicola TaxID=1678845 RepID=A0A1D1YTQ1_9ARAE
MSLKTFDNLGILDYLSLIGILISTFVVHYYFKYFTRPNPLNGPFPFPFIGNYPQLILSGGDLKKYLHLCHTKYGDIYEVYLAGRSVNLSRVEHFEKLLTPSTKNPFIMRMANSNAFAELGMSGKGIILNQNFKSWKYNRQFFSQAILSPKFTDEAIDSTNKLFIELENYWDKLYLKEEIIKENKKELNFSEWFNQYTNDMIINLLTGERSYSMAAYFDTLSNEKSEHPLAIVDDTVKLVQAFRKHLLGLVVFVIVPPLLRHYVPFFKNKADDLFQNMKFINDKLNAIIKRRRQEIENTPLDKPLPNDMLTSMITVNTPRDNNKIKTVDDEAIRPMTDTEIRGNILDGFIGGTDTTANSISFVIYYLAHYPNVKKKMLKEIDRIFQDDKTRPITENDFNKLKYCEAIVKEVARVFPTVTHITRYINRPDEIAGYQWPTDTTFKINIDAIHKNKDDWEDFDKFNPDRWMVEGFEPKKHSFILFGGGLRLCPGRKLAMIELVCLMALLFRKYEIDLVDMNAPLKTESNVVTICTELLVKIKLRN